MTIVFISAAAVAAYQYSAYLSSPCPLLAKFFETVLHGSIKDVLPPAKILVSIDIYGFSLIVYFRNRRLFRKLRNKTITILESGVSAYAHNTEYLTAVNADLTVFTSARIAFKVGNKNQLTLLSSAVIFVVTNCRTIFTLQTAVGSLERCIVF